MQYKFKIVKNIFTPIKYKIVKSISAGKNAWDSDFKIVAIKSPIDNHIGNAYFYASKSKKPQPLIVSLHTWSGNYKEFDYISKLALKNDINYIHPNFRGPNNTEKACCSDFVISDIDASIDYAIKKANVDISKIYVVGASGGGYATLAMLMKSKHKVAKFSAWVPISDLLAFYNESKIRKNNFVKEILLCTNSKNNVLNGKNAKNKSPLYWITPLDKIKNSEITIYAGVNDGIQGNVPITHSINFYNKLVKDMGGINENCFVSFKEKAKILETRKAIDTYPNIGGREVILKKKYNNIKLVIFDGGHEILYNTAFNRLINR